jgi:hypothetical protein
VVDAEYGERGDAEDNHFIAPWFQLIQLDLIHVIALSYFPTKRDSAHELWLGKQI